MVCFSGLEAGAVALDLRAGRVSPPLPLGPKTGKAGGNSLTVVDCGRIFGRGRCQKLTRRESRKVEAAVMVGVPYKTLFPEFLSSLVNNGGFPLSLPSPMCLHLISC